MVEVKVNFVDVDTIIEGVKLGVLRLMERYEANVKTDIRDRPFPPEKKPLIDTGKLLNSVRIVKTTDGWSLVIDAPYAERVETGEPKEFKLFYEGGVLTEFGEWAKRKAGFKESDPPNGVTLFKDGVGWRKGMLVPKYAKPFYGVDSEAFKKTLAEAPQIFQDAIIQVIELRGGK